MQNTFFQKIILTLIFAATTAGLIEAYKFFVADSMEALPPRPAATAPR